MFFYQQVFLNNVIGLIWMELILFSPPGVTGLASLGTHDVLASFTALFFTMFCVTLITHACGVFLVIFVVGFS